MDGVGNAGVGDEDVDVEEVADLAVAGLADLGGVGEEDDLAGRAHHGPGQAGLLDEGGDDAGVQVQAVATEEELGAADMFQPFDGVIVPDGQGLPHQGPAEDANINWLSPIGKAFAKARNDYGFTDAYNYLLYTDNYHPQRYGAYLKACVNYLILFGEPFGPAPADCDVPPADAAKLRAAAEAIVLGPGRETYHVR